MPGSLRALTLWPEWAWAIVNLDKRVENRDWMIPEGQWFALHAGKHIGGRPGVRATCEGIDSLVEMAQRAGWSVRGTAHTSEFIRAVDGKTAVWKHFDVPTSAIVGFFRVTSQDAPGRGDVSGWRVPDAWGNRLDFRPLLRPVPCSGAQGLWTVPPAVAAHAHLGAAMKELKLHEVSK